VAVPTQEFASVPSTRRPSTRAPQEGTGELADQYLVAQAKRGDSVAYDRIVRRYRSFVRLKASSYFLLGGEPDDLVQEGLVGLFKAVRDYRSDRESSFRNFAELCITRQMITAVKTASRNKHAPLNQSISFATSPTAPGEGESTLEEILPGPEVHDPASRVVSTEELRSLVECLTSVLSELESEVLTHYLDGRSYEEIAERLGCDTKKVGSHLDSREVLN
jgi:RNA polymerase sporulation-specific sigma factor